MATVTVTKPPEAPPVPEEAASKPHHVLSRSGATTGFTNTSPSFGGGVGLLTIGRKMLTLALTGKLNSPDTTPPTVTVRKPTFLASRGASDKLRATWLGHACYYVEYPTGLRVLFDPVFEDRCSPFSFLGPKRFTPRPCAIADIPVVDAVVISHSHYDHLSTTSVREIQKHHPDAHFFVGLGLETWFRSAGVERVTEMDWWDDVDVNFTPAPRRPDSPAAETKSVVSSSAGSPPPPPPPSDHQQQQQQQQPIRARISCLPAQHTSGRTGLDKDKTLWCSWAVRSGAHSVFFGGDTGYRAVETETEEARAAAPAYPGFAQVGKLRGPFDLGLIPIGAYAPRQVFSPMHADPVDAVEIFRDTACRRAMGIHWGTWALTVEDVLEPPRLLREALKKRGIAETGVFDVCEIGESREF